MRRDQVQVGLAEGEGEIVEKKADLNSIACFQHENIFLMLRSMRCGNKLHESPQTSRLST